MDRNTKAFLIGIGAFMAFLLIGMTERNIAAAHSENVKQAKYEACLKAQALQVPFDLKCIEIIKEK